MKITPRIRNLLKQSLAEDLEKGDLTTQALIPRNERGEAWVVAKEPGVFCGGDVAREVFRLRDNSLEVSLLVKEGAPIKKNTQVLKVKGRAGSILEAERVALNFLGKLSGIATLTQKFAKKVRGTKAQIFDTRKTTPLWRELEKYAVRTGGGNNHRSGLWDEVLVKDNHWSVLHNILNDTQCRYFSKKLRPLQKKDIPIEVEVRNLKELAHLLQGTFIPDRILLDNFSVKELRRAVLFAEGFFQVLRSRYRIKRKKPELEASGGVTLKNVHVVARTGVSRVSVGALTHSAPSLDFSLKLMRSTM